MVYGLVFKNKKTGTSIELEHYTSKKMAEMRKKAWDDVHKKQGLGDIEVTIKQYKKGQEWL